MERCGSILRLGVCVSVCVMGVLFGWVAVDPQRGGVWGEGQTS